MNKNASNMPKLDKKIKITYIFHICKISEFGPHLASFPYIIVHRSAMTHRQLIKMINLHFLNIKIGLNCS
jgi:hypothetical protein